MDLSTLTATAESYLLWAKALSRIAKPNQFNKSKNLLMLAEHFPPSTSSGVYRPLAFANYGVQNDWSIAILTAESGASETPASRELMMLVDPRLDVTYMRPTGLTPSWRLFPRIDGDLVRALATVDIAKKRFRDAQPSLVFATGPSFQNFVAAFYIARSFHVPFVLDYRDEWTQNPFSQAVTQGSSDFYWEARCLQRASAVLLTTRAQRDHLLVTFPKTDPRKVFYLPNGWEQVLAATPQGSACNNGVWFRYVGVIGEHTPLLDFMNTLETAISHDDTHLDSLRVELVGHVPAPIRAAIARHPLASRISFAGHLEQSAAHQRMATASVLLLLGDEGMSRYRPGKLYQYIASGPPILSYGAPGEVSNVVEGLRIGQRVAKGDWRGLISFLARVTSDHGIVRDNDVIAAWLQEHSRPMLSKKLFGLFDLLIDGQTPTMTPMPLP